jgi:hypothetical protein
VITCDKEDALQASSFFAWPARLASRILRQGSLKMIDCNKIREVLLMRSAALTRKLNLAEWWQ